jgi:hypothetical protein
MLLNLIRSSADYGANIGLLGLKSHKGVGGSRSTNTLAGLPMTCVSDILPAC